MIMDLILSIIGTMGLIAFIADYRLRREDRKSKKQLLRIELNKYESVPKVWYKGERLDTKGLVKVRFDWETDDEFIRLPEIFIKYFAGVNEEEEPIIEEIKKEKEVIKGQWYRFTDDVEEIPISDAEKFYDEI